MKYLDYKWAEKYSVEDVEEFYYLLNERVLLVIMPSCSKNSGKLVDTLISILDLQDTGILKLFTKVNLNHHNLLAKKDD